MKKLLLLIGICGICSLAQDPQIYRSQWYKDQSKLASQNGTVNGLPCYTKDSSPFDRYSSNGLLYVVWRRDTSYNEPLVWREVFGVESNKLVLLRIDKAVVTKARFVPEKVEWNEP